MFNVGDKIVYPMHGAGRIDAIEERRSRKSYGSSRRKRNCNVRQMEQKI